MSDCNTPTKVCTKCGKELPATNEYYPSAKDKRDGLHSWCRRCHADKSKEWRANNPGRQEENNRKWYAKNKERMAENGHEWYIENKDKVIEANRVWRKNNPDRFRAQKQRYRARKRGAEGTHTAEDIQKQYDNQSGKCYYCGKKVGDSYHVDHIVPLSRGGRDDPDNLVISCQHCNTTKHNKLPHEWPEGGHLL